MAERRVRDIEVFALEENDDGRPPAAEATLSTAGAADSHADRGGSRNAQGSPDVVDGPAAEHVDEIRHEAIRSRFRIAPARPGTPLGQSITRWHIAAVVGLLVVAFAAGLLVGRGHRPRPAGLLYGSADGTGEFGSVLPPSARVQSTTPFVTPNVGSAAVPLPSGTAGPQGRVAPAAIFALQLAAKPTNQSGQSLERRDGGALTGPWSLIVRRADGSLGRHSAVVTYPVALSADLPARKQRVRVGSALGYADTYGGIVWPIDGKYAHIRGDLGLPVLAAVAARVNVEHGRPVSKRPPADFHVAAAVPYRAPVVAESRYTDSLRLDSGPIDGLIFTGVVRSGSFEEALYAQESKPAGIIGGHPAVTSRVGGGSGTLAWEPTPGTVVFVGYSGALPAAASTPTLIGLARAGRYLDRAAWQATVPSVVTDTNVYS